jgi:hypothetical protein
VLPVSEQDAAVSVDGQKMTLDIAGLGIVFHSPVFAEHIPEGADYLASSYATEQQVQSHIQQGTIVSFGTGTSGTFTLNFCTGYPEKSFLQSCEFKLRLGLHCRGGVVCFRDLYELMDWHADCPANRTLELDDGFYHVTLCSNPPASGILGDNQAISVYLEKLPALPKLASRGIPTLCS